MGFLKEINEETLFIVPNNLKTKVLRKINSINKLINIKLISFEELKKEVLFNYDEETILYLMEKYNLSYEISLKYIENIYYLREGVSNSKIDFLRKIKEELIKDNKITKDNLFLDYYKNKRVVVWGYSYLTKFNERLLKGFKRVEIIPFLPKKNKLEVLSFETLEDEVLYNAFEIVDLINKGLNLNNIVILTSNDEYKKEFYKVLSSYDIPCDINTVSVISTIMVKDALNYLKNVKTFQNIDKYLEENYDLAKISNHELYNKIISLVNEYNELPYNFEILFKALKYRLKTLKNKVVTYTEEIKFETISNNDFDDDTFVFLVGFNQGEVPLVYKDEDYFSDNQKIALDINTSYELNKLEREGVLRTISNIKNITISYKKRHLDEEFYPSVLLTESSFDIKKININKNRVSEKHAGVIQAKMLDDLIKYDLNNKDLAIYYNSINIPYRTYDNSYNRISPKLLYQYLDSKLVLSYTSIDTFYKCQFRFYLDNILRVTPYEETFHTLIGNLFHYVLSKFYEKSFNLDFEYQKYIDRYYKDREMTPKEEFYLEKLKEELVYVLNKLEDFNRHSSFSKALLEKKLEIDISDSIQVTLKGFIDKVLYKEDVNDTKVAVVDYKTGVADVSLAKVEHGLGMQMLIYLYLIKASKIFENPVSVGFFIHQILSKNFAIDSKKTFLEQKNNALKLHGYVTSDEDVLKEFDSTYLDSDFVSGLKMSKNGFYKYSKVLNKEEFDDVLRKTKEKVFEARDKILAADFTINPKKIKDDLVVCQYCTYQDICFLKNEDYVELNLDDEKVGDDNDQLDG